MTDAISSLQSSFEWGLGLVGGALGASNENAFVNRVNTDIANAESLIMNAPNMTSRQWGNVAAGTTASVGSGLLFRRGPTTSLSSSLGNMSIPVYRVYGGASRINGYSWTFVNPKLMPTNMYRNYAGLPSGNWGTSYIKGSAQIKDISLFRRALPLDGNAGGLPELLINPNKVNMYNYMNRPGNFKSYWGF
ncbi:hypothetical protein RCC89_19540 [Cytophagaceae bacterium ABcell3]|nr:hypothetical protein RCC89_19540 [Cytophagaceae bacterium ABcell3]